MKTFLLFVLCISAQLVAQQVADTLYNPPIGIPEYPQGEGPIVFIDEGHHNFHTMEGRYKSFSNLLERDGYNVKPYNGPFNLKHLNEGKILVISNALHEDNVERWILPTLSAFTPEEIELLHSWVSEGGSLFLIADHMPLAGAAAELALAFEIEFTNGFVLEPNVQGPAFFSLKEDSLIESVITNGRNSDEDVDEIATFTGQAFRSNAPIKPILVLDERYVNLLPDTAWAFHKNTRTLPTDGWYQGAFKEVGKGRLVVFGEAAMFSAQLGGPQKIKMGMNSDAAPQNYQLLLNIIHWLDGKLN